MSSDRSKVLSRRHSRPFSKSRKRTGSRRGTSYRPQLDRLEPRNLLAALTVSSLDDDGAGTLRQAILDANDNPGPDVIRFARGLQGTIELKSQLDITDDVTIRGPGADRIAVSGLSEETRVRVFAVLPEDLVDTPFATPTPEQIASSPDVTIVGLTVRDGLATDALGFDLSSPFAFGGGLYNLGGDVRLDRVEFIENTASNVIAAGGAIANEFGGRLTVTRSHFEGNVSSGALVGVGGAITSDLGPTTAGVTTAPPEVQIRHSSFVDNVAESANGYIEGEAFSGVAAGGAILNVTGAMSVSHSRFEGNTAASGDGEEGSTSGGPALGGAILSGDVSPFGVAESSLRVANSRFVGNGAMAGDGVSDGVAGGLASGGAIQLVSGTDGSLVGNLFESNTAQGGAGGPSAAGGRATGGGVGANGGAEVTTARNRFVANTARGGEGGVGAFAAAGRGGGLGSDAIELAGFFPGTATVRSKSDSFHDNVAYGGIGGGIYNEGELSVHGGSFVGNQAVGVTDVMIDFVPGYVFTGASLGGGISNLGTLSLHASSLRDNSATGADDGVGPNLLNDGAATFPGLAVGGGLHNITEATVTHTQLIGNRAEAGDNNLGTFAGVGNGGGIYSDGDLRLSRSTVRGNAAIGGDGNVGDIGAGTGAGGGVTSGSVAALAGLRSASVVIEQTQVTGNRAVGGDGNESLEGLPLPPAHAPNAAVGGGILIYQGTAEVSGTLITHNRAAGGDSGPGVGGGVYFFGLIGPVEAQLSRSIVAHNTAIGGDGDDGLGGGIAIASRGSIFNEFPFNVPAIADLVSVDVERSLVFGNSAIGGEGGDGLGGGIFNDEAAELKLARSLVFRNTARGGADGGEGIGGGLYNLGDADLIRSRIFANFASTDDDDCFGC